MLEWQIKKIKMRWEVTAMPNAEKANQLQQELGVSAVVAALLAQRGINDFDSAKNFFRPKWEDLHDPFLMTDMDQAVARIQKAIAAKEQMMVFGDYDVDGTTSVALMTTYLKENGGSVTAYIPDRYTEGYGISYQGIDRAAQEKISLIIALDCGIKATEKVAYAKKKGIDFIICDHHLPGEIIPEAIAVLDPKRTDCNYPFDELCGCGIGFKLIQALNQKQGKSEEQLYPYLDLVATAIAADIVPMVGENRTLCFFGLKQLREAPRLGIKCFIEQLKKPLTVSDLVFKIAPRINAAGRMDHALTAAKLLMSETPQEVKTIAEAIETFNAERRATDERITQEALHQIEQREEESHPATVVFHDTWHKGVLGIVASRLIETHYRPTVVLTRSGEDYVGSVRSVKGFNVYTALEDCSAHLLQFGGHKYAAGLTMNANQLEKFKTAFENAVNSRILPEQKEAILNYDLSIDINAIDHKLFRIIEQMAPFGPHNMRPVFKSENCYDSGASRVVGKDRSHLRLSVATNKGSLTGIGFGLAHHFQAIQSGAPFHILYTLDENEWNGTVSLQLRIKDIKF